MKTLFVLRHAEAGWDAADFNRTLTEQGSRDAVGIAATIKNNDFAFDCVSCSTATRARATLQLIQENADLNAEINFEGRIYDAKVEDLLEVVKEIGEGCERILLIGHIPAIEELIIILTGEMRQMPTATLAQIALDISRWNEVGLGVGKLIGVFSPSEN